MVTDLSPINGDEWVQKFEQADQLLGWLRGQSS